MSSGTGTHSTWHFLHVEWDSENRKCHKRVPVDKKLLVGLQEKKCQRRVPLNIENENASGNQPKNKKCLKFQKIWEVSLLPQTSFLVFGLRRGKDLEFCLLNCNNLVGDKKYLLRLRLTAPNGIVLLSKQSLYIKYILFITCHLIDSQCVNTNTSYLMKKNINTIHLAPIGNKYFGFVSFFSKNIGRIN